MSRIELQQVYEDGLPNVEKVVDCLLKEQRLENSLALKIVSSAQKVFAKEDNLLRLEDPISIVGDIHGQFYDLQKIFEIGGTVEESKYLFLGDFVDRGNFGCECVLQLCCMKLRYPDRIFLLRGNHESRHITAYFNFKDECIYKYSEEVYDAIMLLFDSFPLACCLNDRFLCVHGGISPDITCLADINQIDRFKEPPSTGPFCDLLWSDPSTDIHQEEDFEFNSIRNCSYVFSYNAVSQFLEANDLLAVFRAHEVQDEGYRLYAKGRDTGFPTVVCIFSAPNYCDTYGNFGAIVKLVNNSMNIRQFKAVDHPYYLPNFMNVFEWSLPFVLTKVSEIMVDLLLASSEKSVEQEQGLQMDEQAIKALKGKIMALGKMQRMINTLKKEKDTIDQLKIWTGGVLPHGLLSQGGEAIKNELERFKIAKRNDEINEKRPYSKEEMQPVKRSQSFKGRLKQIEKPLSLSPVSSPLIKILQEESEDENTIDEEF